MRKEMVEIEMFEEGDLIDVSKIKIQNHCDSLTKAKKCLVLSCNKLVNGDFNYKVVSNLGNAFILRGEYASQADYISHIDISDFLK